MIKDETIFLVPVKWSHEIVPDWKRCEAMEEKHGTVTVSMIVRELNVTLEKARKILNRWESMKLAREIQGKVCSD